MDTTGIQTRSLASLAFETLMVAYAAQLALASETCQDMRPAYALAQRSKDMQAFMRRRYNAVAATDGAA